MSVWAIVPARGGSKGLPRKNLRLLAGKPLVAHAIEAARQVRAVTRVIVSTDDPEIADASRTAGAEVPFLRPAALAHDRSELRDAIEYTVDRLAKADGPPERILVLYPTHPFRRPGQLDRALELLERFSQVSSAVPLDVQLDHCRVEWQGSQIRLGDARDRLRLYLPTGSFVGMVHAPRGRRSHEDPEAWRRHLARSGPRLGSAALAVLEDPGSGIDINTPEDFCNAEAHLRGEPAPPGPPIASLPYCVVGLRRCCPTTRCEGPTAMLPVELRLESRHVAIWRACRSDGAPFGPLRFHEIVRRRNGIEHRVLFRSNSRLEVEAHPGRLAVTFDLPDGAAGAWVGLGREPDDDVCDLVKPFALPPVWDYDADRGVRRNLLTGCVIRGRQDLPPIVSAEPDRGARVA